jgi:hypothetical protein
MNYIELNQQQLKAELHNLIKSVRSGEVEFFICYSYSVPDKKLKVTLIHERSRWLFTVYFR